MKNRILPFLLSLFIAGAASAQTSTRIGQHDAVTSWKVPANSFASATEGQQIAQQIIDAVGLKPSFQVQAANVPNAAAVVYRGQRYVLYNPTFINSLIKATGTRWAAVSVLAHEIGHHLNGHTLTGGGSQPTLELEADEFSGFVLRKMGASLQDAQVSMKIASQQRASKTHPGQYDRLAAIQKGWNHADVQLGGKGSDIARSAPVVTTPRQAEPERSPRTVARAASPIAAGNILGDIRFNADPNSRYYVTTRYNVVKVTGDNQLSVIGKLASVNNSQYPYTIYDSNTQLFVDRRGNILTKQGRSVGSLSSRS